MQNHRNAGMSPTAEILFVCAMLLTATAFAMLTEMIERRQMRREIARPCAGIRWHRRFPHAQHREIRAFLHVFADAFSIDRLHATKFTPEDDPALIWSARYSPYLTLDDRMEMELFERGMKDAYGIDLRTVWRDSITLGALLPLRSSRQSHSLEQH